MQYRDAPPVNKTFQIAFLTQPICISRKLDQTFSLFGGHISLDGNAPMISNYIEKVRGTCGRFKNLQAVRKTVIIDTEPDVGLRNVQKQRLTQEAKQWD